MDYSSIGEFIKKARRNKKLSLAEISAKTKINERILRAIERDEFDSLPRLIYLKGYINTLCEVLNLNKQQAQTLLEVSYSHEPVLYQPFYRSSYLLHVLEILKSLLRPLFKPRFLAYGILFSFLMLATLYIKTIFVRAQVIANAKETMKVIKQSETEKKSEKEESDPSA